MYVSSTGRRPHSELEDNCWLTHLALFDLRSLHVEVGIDPVVTENEGAEYTRKTFSDYDFDNGYYYDNDSEWKNDPRRHMKYLYLITYSIEYSGG